MLGSSIPAVLRERASLQPNDAAFTFIDYDQNGTAVPETLTWAQLYRRTANIASELGVCGAPGDRAVILAPQGLDYICAFVGSLQAGLIAVPLSVPQAGAHDERVTSVLRDTAPSVILTTSSVLGDVSEYAQATDSDPTVILVDSLDQNSRKRSRARLGAGPDIAYLQYTSGSTREPAGVMVTNRNLSANFEQIYADFFVDFGKVAPPDTTVVSWLPFYHDMGLLARRLRADSRRPAQRRDEPDVVPAEPGAVDEIAGEPSSRHERGTELRLRVGGPPHHRRRPGRP